MKFFKEPDNAYGIVLFFWWNGEKINKERLSYELSMLKNYPIAGLQINYCHGYEGGNYFGLTDACDPVPFSGEWWEILDWFVLECAKYGFKVSLSDYTLSGVGQGFYVDWILRDHPEYHGKKLSYDPESGTVNILTVNTSFNPLKKGSGKKVCEYFFEPFVKHTRGKWGKNFDFFFSDELNFGIDGYLWTEEFEDEFYGRKGYRIEEHYPALFDKTNRKFDQYKLDYYDVMVDLEEENYFQVIYEFHEKHNMTYGCDHGSRGYDPVEFGNYFRTQKYNQGPGCDQPNLASDIIKNKVAASIANVNGRPRVWLEGFYGSGWGTTADELMDAVSRNFVMGHNLLALHGTYYTTCGGWWEWAPPCNTFRMPYWRDMKLLLEAVKRLSYAMSRGYHETQIAILYPVADLQCGYGDGDLREVFEMAEYLYGCGVDFDFVDDEAVGNAEAADKSLQIGSCSYRIFLYPESQVMRRMTREKIKVMEQEGVTVRRIKDKEAVKKEIAGMELLYGVTIIRDGVRVEQFYVNHRLIKNGSLYMLYGIKEGDEVRFRDNGRIFLVDVLTGKIVEMDSHKKNGCVCCRVPRLQVPFLLTALGGEQWMRRCGLKITSSGRGKIPGYEFPCGVMRISLDGEYDVSLLPTCDNRYGDFRLPPARECIGAEVRTFAYREGDDACKENGREERVVYSYGPYYKIAVVYSEKELETVIRQAEDGNLCAFSEYTCSMRYGKKGDPGIQGYHGLKGKVTDDFLVMGSQKETLLGYEYIADGRYATVYYTEFMGDGKPVCLMMGDIKPDRVLVNGKGISADYFPAENGVNELLFFYRGIGRTYCVPVSASAKQACNPYPLAMSFYGMGGISFCNTHHRRYAHLSFEGAPGLRGLLVCSDQCPDIQVGADEYHGKWNGFAWEFNFPLQLYPSKVKMKFELEQRVGKGALLREPVRQICGKGRIRLQDFSKIDGLRAYSGGICLEKEITIEKKEGKYKYELWLEKVISTVEIFVNGKYACTLFCKPWTYNITPYLQSGENKIKFVVYNTLANLYETVPTRYQGDISYGLIGDVSIEVSKESSTVPVDS